MSNGPIGRLFDGPIDVVGDVHGEIAPLLELIEHLGYDRRGSHAKGRRLVFIGDLCDRGPDSPAVIEWVRALVQRGVAQCLLGNHELNLLRRQSKHSNRWFIDPQHPEQQPRGEFSHSRPAPEALKEPWLAFFAELPLALERADLRVVHAAWLPAEVAALRDAQGSTTSLYSRFEDITVKQLMTEGLLPAARHERARWQNLLADRNAEVPLLTAIGECDERYQMGNPVRILTSGVDRLASRPIWSNGQWRMCDRVPWWKQYDESTPVIIGHYWRHAVPSTPSGRVWMEPEIFEEGVPTEWVGAQGNVFCVDFSAGGRYRERSAGHHRFETHLAAMRWPERQLWFETGRV